MLNVMCVLEASDHNLTVNQNDEANQNGNGANFAGHNNSLELVTTQSANLDGDAIDRSIGETKSVLLPFIVQCPSNQNEIDNLLSDTKVFEYEDFTMTVNLKTGFGTPFGWTPDALIKYEDDIVSRNIPHAKTARANLMKFKTACPKYMFSKCFNSQKKIPKKTEIFILNRWAKSRAK